MTHHGPHRNSVRPRYGGDLLNAAFVSNLTPLLEQADLWVHGHVHDSFDYVVGKCRVVANPRGYARNRLYAETPNQLEWENPTFDPQLVVEVWPRRMNKRMNKRDTEQLGQHAIEMLLNDAQAGLRDSVAGRVLSEKEFRTRLIRV